MELFNYYDKFIFSQDIDSINIIEKGFFIDLTNSEIDFLKKCFSSEYWNQNDYSISYFHPPIYSIELNSIRLFGSSGGIAIDDNLLVESFFSQKKMFKSESYRRVSFLKKKYSKEGYYTSIFHQYSLNNNLFHWYIECLPRLHILSYLAKKSITVLCPSNLMEFQKEQIIRLLSNFCNVKIEYVNEADLYIIENYTFLSFLNNTRSGYLPKFALDYYSNIEIYNFRYIKNYKRIYINRCKRNIRDIYNKIEFEQLMKGFGFESIILEDFTIEQQIQIFKTAEVVIGVHGAGLTNIIFSDKIKVIELHPENKINPPYFFLSKSKKIEYYYLICNSIDKLNNIYVNIEALKKLFISIL